MCRTAVDICSFVFTGFGLENLAGYNTLFSVLGKPSPGESHVHGIESCFICDSTLVFIAFVGICLTVINDPKLLQWLCSLNRHKNCAGSTLQTSGSFWVYVQWTLAWEWQSSLTVNDRLAPEDMSFRPWEQRSHPQPCCALGFLLSDAESSTGSAAELENWFCTRPDQTHHGSGTME